MTTHWQNLTWQSRELIKCPFFFVVFSKLFLYPSQITFFGITVCSAHLIKYSRDSLAGCANLRTFCLSQFPWHFISLLCSLCLGTQEFFRSSASKIGELSSKIILLWAKISIFQNTSLWIYTGFNRILIAKDFKFTIKFLGKTKGEKRWEKTICHDLWTWLGW